MIPEEHSQKVQLGCGTLILIALIVLLFSNGNRGTADLENKVRDLTTEIRGLKSAVERQTQEFQAVQAKLTELKNR